MLFRPPVSFRDHLRLVTREAHSRLEAEVDLDGRLTSLAVYRSFLEDFYRFVGPLEAVLARLDLSEIGLDYASRRKLPLIEADLLDLGHSSKSLDAIPPFDGIPHLCDPVEALGVLYVLEGSSLGRQVMLLKLRARLGVRPDWGGHFFNGYGQETSAMWQSFIAILNDAGKSVETARLIEAAASATFAAFGACLAEKRLQGAA